MKRIFQQKHRTILFFVLVILYYCTFWSLSDITDTAFFGGDTWEYQSIAVNFAKGHGIQKFGGMEPFDTYKFEKQNPMPDYFNYFSVDLAAGEDRFYRTPLYPLFLGIVYKTFGISPAIAKLIQLLMLVVVAAALPFIGKHYYGRVGFVAGIPAGVLYLSGNYKLCTEPLITLAVFFVLLAIIVYEARPQTFMAVILGVAMGLALLTKGSLIFIPILLCAYIFIITIRKRDPNAMKRLVLIIASTLFTILPWSLYASIRSGTIIILSTQGPRILLTYNNEFCADGRWHPEGMDKKESYYNNDGMEKAPAILKVVNFYWKNPRLFLQIMSSKLINGFWPFIYFWLFVIFVLIIEVCRIGNNWVRAGPSKIVFFSTILAIIVLVCFFNQAIFTYLFEIKRLRLILLLIGVFGWVTYLFISGKLSVLIPTSFLVILGNFLLLILVSGALTRFVAPMDFIFALICCVSAVHLFWNIWEELSKNYNREI